MEKKKVVNKKNKGKLKRKILRGLVYLVLIVFALSLFFLLGFGIYKIFTAKSLNITTVKVEGNTKYDTETVLKLADVKIGTNIHKLSKNKVEKQVETLSYVKDVDVSRKYPSTIVIKIKEYKSSFAAFNNDTNKYVRLTDKGIILEVCESEDLVQDELILFGIHFDDKLASSIVDLEKEKLQSFLEINKIYAKTGIEKKITSVEFKEGDIILTLDQDIDVVMDKQDTEYKLNLLRSILNEINGKTGEIDMTIENPIFKENIK